MTKIKFCGLTRTEDILAANELRPEYIGFVFAEKSKRYVPPEKGARLKALLSPDIQAVGVFVNERAENIARLLNNGTIDIAQLHGDEDERYIRELKKLTDKPIIKAFRITTKEDVQKAEKSCADIILLDSGAGTGTVFDWSLLSDVKRPYFLAGGLNCENIERAIRTLKPYAADVSSGIETDSLKDKNKMAAFSAVIRKENKL